jgi:hypothetical protein
MSASVPRSRPTPLDVNGAGRFTSNITLSTANSEIIGGGSSWIDIPYGLYLSGGTTYDQTDFVARGGIMNDSAPYLQINDGTSGYTYFNGNVGIGTTTAIDSGVLSIEASSGSAMTNALVLDNSSTAGKGTQIVFYQSGTPTAVGTISDAFTSGPGWVMNLGTYGEANTLTLTQTGYVGIGSTGPGYPLDVVGDIRTSTCLHYASSTLGTCSSDALIKRDVTPYDLGLDAVTGLKPVTYAYNGLGGNPDDGKRLVGLIAQDVEKVAPQLVGTKAVKLHPGDKADTEIRTVDYGALTYLLINAVRELKSLFDGDHADIAALKAENDNLRAELKADNDNFERRLQALEAQRR